MSLYNLYLKTKEGFHDILEKKIDDSIYKKRQKEIIRVEKILKEMRDEDLIKENNKKCIKKLLGKKVFNKLRYDKIRIKTNEAYFVNIPVFLKNGLVEYKEEKKFFYIEFNLHKGRLYKNCSAHIFCNQKTISFSDKKEYFTKLLLKYIEKEYNL